MANSLGNRIIENRHSFSVCVIVYGSVRIFAKMNNIRNRANEIVLRELIYNA